MRVITYTTSHQTKPLTRQRHVDCNQRIRVILVCKMLTYACQVLVDRRVSDTMEGHRRYLLRTDSSSDVPVKMSRFQTGSRVVGGHALGWWERARVMSSGQGVEPCALLVTSCLFGWVSRPFQAEKRG